MRLLLKTCLIAESLLRQTEGAEKTVQAKTQVNEPYTTDTKIVEVLSENPLFIRDSEFRNYLLDGLIERKGFYDKLQVCCGYIACRRNEKQH